MDCPLCGVEDIRLARIREHFIKHDQSQDILQGPCCRITCSELVKGCITATDFWDSHFVLHAPTLPPGTGRAGMATYTPFEDEDNHPSYHDDAPCNYEGPMQDAQGPTEVAYDFDVCLDMYVDPEGGVFPEKPDDLLPRAGQTELISGPSLGLAEMNDNEIYFCACKDYWTRAGWKRFCKTEAVREGSVLYPAEPGTVRRQLWRLCKRQFHLTFIQGPDYPYDI